MSVSLGVPKNHSTHGRALLIELRDRSTARIEFVLECLEKDKLSGRLKEVDTGNNAYHLLIIGNYPADFTMTVLLKLLDVCPDGVRGTNNNGSLPLHLSLTTPRLNSDLITTLLTACPTAASKADNQGLIPLFLCCMREDATADLCKSLCKAFPFGPATQNKTHSYPLHFAAKRRSPNLDILRILIKRHALAAECVNDFGLLPLHCICALSDNVNAIEMIYSANPNAVKVVDRQGRTCLHLAVLFMGREHSSAVLLEEEEQRLQAQLEEAERQDGETNTGAVDWGSDDSDNENTGKRNKNNNSNQSNQLDEREGGSRLAIRFLIAAYPQALCIDNNFRATPVDTVLEKMKPQRTKNKIVSVYGLYDDPPTARLLLMMQRSRTRAFNEGKTAPIVLLPNLRSRHSAALREFNWAARREALFVSLLGEPRYSAMVKKDKKTPKETGGFFLKYRPEFQCGGIAATSVNKKVVGVSKSGVTKSVGGAKKTTEVGGAALETVFSCLNLTGAGAGDAVMLENALSGNILARLRYAGLQDIVRAALSYV